jgi:hypothetical protein
MLNQHHYWFRRSRGGGEAYARKKVSVATKWDTRIKSAKLNPTNAT